MTGRDLQILFCTTLASSGMSPVVLSRDAFDVLERAQEELVQELVSKAGSGQTVREGLQPLVRTLLSTPRVLVGSSEADVRLPADYRHFLRAVATTAFSRTGRIQVSELNGVEIPSIQRLPTVTGPVKMVETDDLMRLSLDPFNRSRKEEPLAYLQDGYLRILIRPSFRPIKVTLTYIKKPASISRNSVLELPDGLLRAVVDRAAQLYQGGRIQTASTPGD